MLRITWLDGPRPLQTLNLEGKFVGPWVDEVRKLCSHSLARSSRIGLDLSDVTFVDAAGIQLLRDLVRQGIEIVSCSNFVAELIQPEQS